MDDPFDVVVIGSGPGGYVAAIRAAQLGLKTACIEKQTHLGGTCLNVGCIPSKALLHSTQHGGNFLQMMERKEKIVSGFNQGIDFLFKKNKITRYTGHATLLSSTEIAVAGMSHSVMAKNIILATGSEPIALPFLPFDEKRILSSTGALALQAVPKRLVIIGAGVIGVELGSVYARLGSQVLFIEFLDRVCPTFDPSLSKELQRCLEKQGMQFKFSSRVTGADIGTDSVTLKVGETAYEADAVLVAIGRRPYSHNLGLEKLRIAKDPKGFLLVDGQFRTSIPNIFAIGDLIDGPMLAHKAEEEGIAAAEIIGGKTPHIDYLAIASVVYTSPEVASVGLSEAEAKSFNLSFKTGIFPFKANSRARCTSEEDGFVKVLAETATDRIIGVHIIGAHASELIAEGALAIVNKLTAAELGHTPHAHPTLSEAVKEAALAIHGHAIHI